MAFAPSPPDRSTHFLFSHKVFTLPGCRFRLSRSTGEPVMLALLGKVEVELPLGRVAAEFGIDPEGDDGQLLRLAAQALAHVRQVKPGESIPNELVDGTASWRVTDHHHEAAKTRLTVQLVTWFSGGERVITSPEELAQVAEDPTTKARVRDAFRLMANKLAMADDGTGTGGETALMDRIDALAGELAYVEALRDRFRALDRVRQGLEAAHKIYRLDRTLKEEIVRMQTLAAPPLADLGARFDQLDAQTGEVMTVLRRFDHTIRYIRVMRDDVHQVLMLWDDILDAWQSLESLEKGPELEGVLRQTYQFLARRFSQASNWQIAHRPGIA